MGLGGIGKAQSAKASSMILMLLLVARRHAAPLKSLPDQDHVLFQHNGADSEEKLLSDATLFGVIVVDVERHHCEGFLAAGRLPSKGSRRYDTLYHPTRFPFKHLVRQVVPDIVKVDGLDVDVRKESVLVEQYCTPSIVGHVESIREKLAVNILNR